MKGKMTLVFICALFALAISACTSTGQKSVDAKTGMAGSGHPVALSSTGDCTTCHLGSTPALTAQWEASVHGLTGVKCGVCHGDVANFTKSPGPETCIGCHAKQVESVDHNAGQACKECHTPHMFTAAK